MVAVGHWNLTYYWNLEASGSLNNLQKWKVTALLFWGRGIWETPLFCFTFQRQYLMCVLFISQNIPTNKLDCGKKSGHVYVCMHSFKRKDKEICGVSCFSEVPLHWPVIPEDRHLAVETLKAINRPSAPVHTESLNWRPFNSFFWKCVIV